MIPPIEWDDALDALRAARDRLGYAIDALHDVGAPRKLVETFTAAHDATSWSIERVSSAIVSVQHATRVAYEMENVEERHVEGQMFPWAEDDLR